MVLPKLLYAMGDLLIGIIGGIVTSILIYSFRFYLSFIINTIFFRIYLNVSGEYKVLEFDFDNFDDGSDDEDDVPMLDDHNAMVKWLKEGEEEPFYTVKLKQFAHRLYGEMTVIEEGRVTEVYKISGSITPTRVITLNTECKTKDHHNYGTFLLKVTQNSNIFRGGYDFLCIHCGNVGSTYVFLDKVK